MTQYVSGEGPTPCDLMFVGEGPGKDEDKWGRPFVGKSGKELNRYVWNAIQRTRTSVYCTNLIKYRVPDDGDPTPEDILRDAPTLEREIKRCNPEVVVCLGRWAARYFLGDCDMDWCHGIPHWDPGHNVAVMPIVHPAAGLHSTEFQGTIAWDFEQLGKLLRGEIEAQAPVDEYPDPVYREVESASANADIPVAIDTEGSVKAPWCLSMAVVSGRAAAYRPRPSRSSPFLPVSRIPKRVILHSALHDIPVLRAMGIEGFEFDDTMIKAYLLGVEPQGLKALARRHCGMAMNDYNDLVEVPNRELALGYLAEVGKWLSRQSNSALPELLTTSSKNRKRTSAKGGRKSSRTALPKKLSRR